VEVFNKLEIPNSYYYAIEEEAEASSIENEEYLISDYDILQLYSQAEKSHNLSIMAGDCSKLREGVYNSMVDLGNVEYAYLLNDQKLLSPIIPDLVNEFRDNFSVFNEKLPTNRSATVLGETLIDDLPDSVDQLLQSLEIAPTIESVARKLPYLYNDLITELYYCR
jgi:hypothetical protein